MAEFLLVNTPATLQAVFYVGETATDPSPATATVTITDADGNAVATNAATTRTSAGTFTYSLAAQAKPKLLTAVWTGGDGRKVTTYHEVVGGFYANLAELRSLDGLSDSVAYPTAALASARQRAQEVVEDVTGVAWVPRFAREELSGEGTSWLTLDHMYPQEVIAVTIDGASVADLTQFRLYDHGRIERLDDTFDAPSGLGRNVAVSYVHGFDYPPEDVRLAFLRLARHIALSSNTRIDERATSLTTEMGTMSFTTAGTKRPTGLPEVDAVLMRHSHRYPRVG